MNRFQFEKTGLIHRSPVIKWQSKLNLTRGCVRLLHFAFGVAGGDLLRRLVKED